MGTNEKGYDVQMAGKSYTIVIIWDFHWDV